MTLNRIKSVVMQDKIDLSNPKQFFLSLNIEYILACTEESKQRLQKAGFQQLSEREAWTVEAGGKYFFTRNFSTIVAFAVGKK